MKKVDYCHSIIFYQHRPSVSLETFFAESNLDDPNVMSVLFVITVDPSIPVTSFASIASESNYGDGEGEILFSMHSIFRIGETKQVAGNPRLWQVELTLTNDNDSQLMAVRKIIEEETSSQYVGWYRLGKLLIKLGEYYKAQELYETLLEQTHIQEQQIHLYHILGAVYMHQGDSLKALMYYKQSLEMKKKILLQVNLFLNTYTAIADVLNHMSERLPANHSVLGNIYSRIGAVYMNMKQYSKALVYYQKNLEISQKFLPANDMLLAIYYNNIAQLFKAMSDHEKALEYLQHVLEIRRQLLSPDDPKVKALEKSIENVKKKI